MTAVTVDSNASLLPFVLIKTVSFFSKSSQTLHNETFKFCGTHVSLAADKVSRKFINMVLTNNFKVKGSHYFNGWLFSNSSKGIFEIFCFITVWLSCPKKFF